MLARIGSSRKFQSLMTMKNGAATLEDKLDNFLLNETYSYTI
jgi:hypothetical protein